MPPATLDGALHDVAVERSMMRLLVTEPTCLEKRDGLPAEWFFDPANRIYCRELFWLADNGKPADALALAARLREVGVWEQTGGNHHWSEVIGDGTGAPASLEFPHYISRLQTLFQKRDLEEASRQASEALQRPGVDLGIVRDRLVQAVERIGAETRSNGLPPIRRSIDIDAEPEDLPPDLIRGILHRSSKLVLGGGSKSFKTWTLLDMAVSVASGRDWLGFPCERANVLFINFEVQKGFFRKRLNTILSARGISKPPELYEWHLRGHSARIETLIPEIIRQVKGGDYGLIILDPIYKLLQGRDENAAGDIGEAMNELERLAVQSGAAIAFGAHFAKGNASGKSAIDRISGSGVFARDPDSILTLTPHEEGDCFTLDAILRNHAPVEPFVVRWDFPLMRQDGALDPVKLKQNPGAFKTVYTVEQVVQAFDGKAWLYTDLSDRCKELFGMSLRTFKDRFAELNKSGRILQEGGKWRLK